MPQYKAFEEFVRILQGADFVVVQLEDSEGPVRRLADVVGYEEEGDEESNFLVGPGSGFDDITIKHGTRVEVKAGVFIIDEKTKLTPVTTYHG